MQPEVAAGVNLPPKVGEWERSRLEEESAPFIIIMSGPQTTYATYTINRVVDFNAVTQTDHNYAKFNRILINVIILKCSQFNRSPCSIPKLQIAFKETLPMFTS